MAGKKWKSLVDLKLRGEIFRANLLTQITNKIPSKITLPKSLAT